MQKTLSSCLFGNIQDLSEVYISEIKVHLTKEFRGTSNITEATVYTINAGPFQETLCFG